MKLRQNEYCPIHRSLRCCGREETHCVRTLQPGIRRIDDPRLRAGISRTPVPSRNTNLLKRKVAEHAFTFFDVLPRAQSGFQDFDDGDAAGAVFARDQALRNDVAKALGQAVAQSVLFGHGENAR